ncbi:MAG: exo-alpha-sialidase [Gammaproteobacteria bacterium]|nr:MAG: exo-alpha-sialidase [Gammaproteobacteria bacterium]
MVTNRLLFRRMISWSVETASRLSGGPQRNPDPAIVYNEFIVDPAPTSMSHASSIAACDDDLIAAWFGGSLESRPDVAIFVARNTGDGWSEPRVVATGKQDNGARYACWNPVLFQPASGPLLLFYKVGKNPRTWWGMLTTSNDGGKNWAPPQRLPDGILGPIKNKPVQLASGELLCPSSAEHDGWRVHLEHSSDQGESWRRTMPIGDGRSIAAIQPSILVHRDRQLQLLCRSKHHRIAESWSSDGGISWTELQLTNLPNPNSGTDAVTLADGRHLLVYNRSSRGRSPLNVGLSDDGRCWRDVLVLEQGRGEYSYPAVIQTHDGLVHITYSWNLSRIRHLTIDPLLL